MLVLQSPEGGISWAPRTSEFDRLLSLSTVPAVACSAASDIEGRSWGRSPTPCNAQLVQEDTRNPGTPVSVGQALDVPSCSLSSDTTASYLSRVDVHAGLAAAGTSTPSGHPRSAGAPGSGSPIYPHFHALEDQQSLSDEGAHISASLPNITFTPDSCAATIASACMCMCMHMMAVPQLR